MKAIREKSIIVKPIKSETIVNGVIMSGFNGFNEGEVISSNFEGVEDGDIVIYDDALTIGEYKIVFEHNVIAKK